jgi:hypothetical protein
MSLQRKIEGLSFTFAQSIIAALRTASLDDLNGLSRARVEQANGAAKTRGGRLRRRSAEDIEKTLEQIVHVLGAHPTGLRAEQLRAELHLDAKEMPRPLADGLSSGRLAKTGQRRATVYTLGSGTKQRGGRRKREA